MLPEALEAERYQLEVQKSPPCDESSLVALLLLGGAVRMADITLEVFSECADLLVLLKVAALGTRAIAEGVCAANVLRKRVVSPGKKAFYLFCTSARTYPLLASFEPLQLTVADECAEWSLVVVLGLRFKLMLIEISKVLALTCVGAGRPAERRAVCQGSPATSAKESELTAPGDALLQHQPTACGSLDTLRCRLTSSLQVNGGRRSLVAGRRT